MFFARNKTKFDQTVFVGVSGGVDSSVATKRLIDQGYHVVGAFMKTWYPDWLPCDWKAERRDAMRVCARLSIPFVEYDLGQSYFEKVGMYLVDEYEAGRTPNPDVMCNRHVKFDAFWEAAAADGADYIATGHYAANAEIPNPKSQNPNDKIKAIKIAKDTDKDQTYFLWGIKPEVVPHVLLPIGDTVKSKIRTEAERANLITANKPDSQGICFLGQVDLVEFLGHYLDLRPGKVIDIEGKEIGVHQSAFVYTIGQRHGFTINDQSINQEPLFVINKDVEKNILTVGTESQLEKVTTQQEVKLIQTNWLVKPEANNNYLVRYRYRQGLLGAKAVELNNDNKTASFKFDINQSGIAPGQSLVVYKDDLLIGGGIIA